MNYTYENTVSPNIDKIQSDIADSDMSDKTVEYCTYNSITKDLVLTFTNSLSAGDITILDGIVSGNDNYTLLKYKINNSYNNPTDKNINLFSLHRKDVIDAKGSLVTKEYYKNYDGTTYSDLVVKDEYVYTFNPTNDLVTLRNEKITWYLEDDSIGTVKNIVKYYGLVTSIKEGVARRTNLLNNAKAFGLAYISGMHESGIPNSYYWFSTMQSEVKNYLEGTKKQDLIDFIDNATETYITQTVKDGMTDILDYWTT